MKENMYHPTDNYERNFLLVKKFGGKAIVFITPMLMLIDIICLGYLSISDRELMELTLFKVVTSKTSSGEFEISGVEKGLILFACITMMYFTVVFLLFFLSSKDLSRDSVPTTSLNLAYFWSFAQLVLSIIGFITTLMILVLYIAKGPVFFEGFGKLFGLTLNQLKSYNTSIILSTLLLCMIFAMLIWFSQSQTEFVKSIRVTLKNSVARNNGAHTYGVFSMAVSVFMLCLAGIMTFIYYCYKDAFNGFGISMENGFVWTSLAIAYLRGLIPFFVSVCALTFSEMVEEANTLGTVYYNDIDTIGEVFDPNMNRKIQ